jgi:hypothetical protein
LITASGPTSFVGSGTSFQANFGEGDIFGVAGFGHQIYAPQGYVSGSSLMADDTFSFTTLAALGLTPGTYTYTWGTDAHADSLVLNIGSPSAVPEPSSLAMCGLAGLIGASYAWRRRQRAPSA